MERERKSPLVTSRHELTLLNSTLNNRNATTTSQAESLHPHIIQSFVQENLEIQPTLDLPYESSPQKSRNRTRISQIPPANSSASVNHPPNLIRTVTPIPTKKTNPLITLPSQPSSSPSENHFPMKNLLTSPQTATSKRSLIVNPLLIRRRNPTRMLYCRQPRKALD